MEESLKIEEKTQGPGIHHSGLCELGLLFRRFPDAGLQMLQNPGDPIKTEECIGIAKDCREGIEEAQHRPRPRIGQCLPCAIAPQPDFFGQIFPGSSLNETLEKPGGDVSRISPGGKEKVAGKETYFAILLAQGCKTDDKVSARVSISNGKDIDAIQEIRPCCKAFYASGKGLPEVLHHGSEPKSNVMQRHFDVRIITMSPEEVGSGDGPRKPLDICVHLPVFHQSFRECSNPTDEDMQLRPAIEVSPDFTALRGGKEVNGQNPLREGTDSLRIPGRYGSHTDLVLIVGFRGARE
jgi:hypothetical protein